MSDKKFFLEKVINFDDWSQYIKNSPQGSLFFYDFYLKFCEVNYDLWWIKEPTKDNPKTRAAICLITSDDKKSIIGNVP